jgi:chromosome segregation ATPase
MPEIDVRTETLAETADRLRSATVEARRLRLAIQDADVTVTGSTEVSAALSQHTEEWDHSLDRLHARLRSLARALDTSARTYNSVERALTTASTP